MYQIQMKFNKTGEWIDTVYGPLPQMMALKIMANFNKTWSEVHVYRIIPVN